MTRALLNICYGMLCSVLCLMLKCEWLFLSRVLYLCDIHDSDFFEILIPNRIVCNNRFLMFSLNAVVKRRVGKHKTR